jgi:hypothetical protein
MHLASGQLLILSGLAARDTASPREMAFFIRTQFSTTMNKSELPAAQFISSTQFQLVRTYIVQRRTLPCSG